MPQIREQIAMVHLPPSKTLKYLFHVRKTSILLRLARDIFMKLTGNLNLLLKRRKAI